MRSYRALILAATTGLCFVLLFMLDWPLGLLASFWAAHGMVTNLVASLMFALVGLTILAEWSSRREAERLRVVVLAGYHAVARIPLMHQRVMLTLSTGRSFGWDADFFVSAGDERRADEARARQGLPPLQRSDVTGESVSPSMEERLTALAHDPEWIELCYGILRDTSHTSRRVLARWAALMVSTRESTRLLTEIALELEELAILVSWFRRRSTASLYEVRRPAPVDELLIQWRRTIENAAALEEKVRLKRIDSAAELLENRIPSIRDVTFKG